MQEVLVKTGKLVTVFGGSGFVGRSVAKALAEHGWRVRVACRNPWPRLRDAAVRPGRPVDRGPGEPPLSRLGRARGPRRRCRRQSRRASRAGRDADVRGNPYGGRADRRRGGEGRRHHQLRADVGDRRRSRLRPPLTGAPRPKPRRSFRASIIPSAVILRPSVVFGSGGQVLQPLRRHGATDAGVAADRRRRRACCSPSSSAMWPRRSRAPSTEKRRPARPTSSAAPTPHSFKDILAFILKTIGAPSGPSGAAAVSSRRDGWPCVTEVVKKATLGLLPEMLDMTKDQVELLKSDNIVSASAKAEGRTLQGPRHHAGILSVLHADLPLSVPQDRAVCGSALRADRSRRRRTAAAPPGPSARTANRGVRMLSDRAPGPGPPGRSRQRRSARHAARRSARTSSSGRWRKRRQFEEAAPEQVGIGAEEGDQIDAGDQQQQPGRRPFTKSATTGELRADP